MSDIYCAKCGEPWDSYGITWDVGEGDMTPAEVKRFRKGEGCPACEFATICTRCRGTGIEPGGSVLHSECQECHDQHYLIVQRWGVLQKWQVGYAPGNKPFPGNPVVIKQYPSTYHPDGNLERAKVLCPFCTGEPCSTCNGDGKFHGQGDPLRGLESLLDASDEDPIDLIDGYSLD